MSAVSSPSRQMSWQGAPRRVSVLAEMALRAERVVQKLIELRERDDLTQEEAAHKVGVTVRQWQRWEAGDSMPYPRNLDLIASRFRISAGSFFDEEEPQLQLENGNDDQAQLDHIEAMLEAVVAHLGISLDPGERATQEIEDAAQPPEDTPADNDTDEPDQQAEDQ